MILSSLLFYAQAHRGLGRIFNNLAIPYDQAHGSYDEAHARAILVKLASG